MPVEQALVVVTNDGPIGAAQGVYPVGDDLERIDIKPESVSSKMASFGSRTAIYASISRFRFSPPENLRSRPGF